MIAQNLHIMHNMRMKLGKLIVIDGVDGSGKSTEILFLKKELAKAGSSAIFTDEPGGTPKAEEIRKVLLGKTGAASTPRTDFFLFWAARASHIEQLILPALRAGRNVISDRFDSSTFAFQVCAEKHPELEVLFYECRKTILSECIPNAYIFLDLPVDEAIARRKNDRSKLADSFDRKGREYHERVREGFRKFKPGEKSEVFLVDANRRPEQVHKEVWSIVRRTLG